MSATLRPSLLGVRLGTARRTLDRLAQRQSLCLARFSNQERNRFERIASRLRPASIVARIAESRKDVGVLERRGSQALQGRITLGRRRLEGGANMLRTLSYQSVLARGFALVRQADGTTVRTASSLSDGTRIVIEFSDGKVGADVKGPSGEGSHSSGGKSKASDPPRPRASGGKGSTGSGGGSHSGGQGTLF